MLLLLALTAARCGDGRSSEPVGGVEARPSSVKLLHPQSVPLLITWTPRRPLDPRHGRVIAFVHLVVPGEKKNEVFRTFDHVLPKRWVAGETQTEEIDLYQSALAEPLPPGRYVLSIGLYDQSFGNRWPLKGGPEVAKREYRVADVEVGGQDPSAPQLTFSGAWEPLETVPSRQVLARRPFFGTVSLSVESRAAGTVRFQVTVPPKDGPAEVRVISDCLTSGGEVVPSGRSRWMGVDIAPGRCSITFEASPAGAAGTSASAPASLDVVSWRPR